MINGVIADVTTAAKPIGRFAPFVDDMRDWSITSFRDAKQPFEAGIQLGSGQPLPTQSLADLMRPHRVRRRSIAMNNLSV